MKTRYALAAGWLLTSAPGIAPAQVLNVVATSQSVPVANGGAAVPVREEAIPDRRDCETPPSAGMEMPQQQSNPTTPGCLQVSALTNTTGAGATDSGTSSVPFDIGPRSRDSLANAGNRVALDMTGDGLITVQIDHAVFEAALANTGTMHSDGRVILSANSADVLLNTVLNNVGLDRAASLTERAGSMYLEGGPAGVALASAGSSSNVLPGGAPSAGTPPIIVMPSTGVPPVDYSVPPFSVPPIGTGGAPIVIAPPLVVPPVATGGTAIVTAPPGVVPPVGTGGTPIVTAPPVVVPPVGAGGTVIVTAPPIVVPPVGAGGTPIVTAPPVVVPPVGTGGTPIVTLPPVVVPPSGNPAGGPPIIVPAVSAPRGVNGAGRPFVVGIPGNTPAGTPAASGVTGRPPFAGSANGTARSRGASTGRPAFAGVPGSGAGAANNNRPASQ